MRRQGLIYQTRAKTGMCFFWTYLCLYFKTVRFWRVVGNKSGIKSFLAQQPVCFLQPFTLRENVVWSQHVEKNKLNKIHIIEKSPSAQLPLFPPTRRIQPGQECQPWTEICESSGLQTKTLFKLL